MYITYYDRIVSTPQTLKRTLANRLSGEYDISFTDMTDIINKYNIELQCNGTKYVPSTLKYDPIFKMVVENIVARFFSF